MTEWNELIAALGRFDTPTICNAAELVDSSYKTTGFSTMELRSARPGSPQTVGFARTARYSGGTQSRLTDEEQSKLLFAYYDYIEKGGPRPSIAVIQDIDTVPNRGCFWGEVNTNVHRSLGAIAGLTNGGIRDVHLCAEGFSLYGGRVVPSHGLDNFIDFGGKIAVAGVDVSTGDVIHIDQHGFCVLTPDKSFLAAVAKKAELVTAREAVILSPARKGELTTARLMELFSKMEQIH